jgi:hypothetical protein
VQAAETLLGECCTDGESGQEPGRVVQIPKVRGSGLVGASHERKSMPLRRRLPFRLGGEQGIFMEYASQDGRTLKALRLRDKEVCVTTSRT